MVLKFDFLEFLKTYIPAINYDYLLFELNVCPSDRYQFYKHNTTVSPQVAETSTLHPHSLV